MERLVVGDVILDNRCLEFADRSAVVRVQEELEAQRFFDGEEVALGRRADLERVTAGGGSRSRGYARRRQARNRRY